MTEKIQFFQDDTGRFVRLDQIVSYEIIETYHQFLVKLTMTDGSWVYVQSSDFEEKILPKIEVLFSTTIGKKDEPHIVPTDNP